MLSFLTDEERAQLAAEMRAVNRLLAATLVEAAHAYALLAGERRPPGGAPDAARRCRDWAVQLVRALAAGRRYLPLARLVLDEEDHPARGRLVARELAAAFQLLRCRYESGWAPADVVDPALIQARLGLLQPWLESQRVLEGER